MHGRIFKWTDNITKTKKVKLNASKLFKNYRLLYVINMDQIWMKNLLTNSVKFVFVLYYYVLHEIHK